MDLTSQRAYRILRRTLVRYQDIHEHPHRAPAWLAEVPLHAGELWLGVYVNSPEWSDRDVAVSTQGLYIQRGNAWKAVRYDDMTSVDGPEPHEKHTADRLRVHTISGASVEVPIVGGRDRLRDVWTFKGFLIDVIRDFQLGRV